MRILKATEPYAPFLEHGRPPVKVRALAEALARRGHSVTVLTADWGLSERGGGDASPFGLRREENGVDAYYLNSLLRYRTLTWNPAVRTFCRERLSSFDAVHIYGLYDLLGPSVASACRLRGIPCVVEPIGMFVPIVRNLWLKKLYLSLIGYPMVRGAAAVVATSKKEAAGLQAGGVPASRVVLRRNGVELPSVFPPRGSFRKRHNIPTESRLILFLGRIVEKKSPDLLLRAFAQLDAFGPGDSPRLAFAGPGDEKMLRQLRELSAALGVQERVLFTGPLFGEEKWAAFRDSDVFVLPSKDENFGNATAEALAAETPAIVTENCGIAELLRDGAAVVIPHDEPALASALRRVLSEVSLRRELRQRGSAVVARLGWEEPAREMELLYEKLRRQSYTAGAALARSQEIR